MIRSLNRLAARRRVLRIGGWTLCLWLVFIPVASADSTADDPVVADVVRMLDAGLEARLIRDWLDAGDHQPAQMSANDMIALAAANAPAELIEDLLRRSTRAPDAVETAERAPPVSDQVEKDISSPTAINPDGDDCCLVDFTVEYRAPEQDAAEQGDAPREDLYLYIDGQFLGRFAPRGEIAGRGAQVFKYRIEPGRHTIRLTRELHLLSKNKEAGDARDHRTTVSPSSINFELQPGAQWALDIRWTQGVFSGRRPLSWRWSRNGSRVAGEDRAGAFQEDWPFLCDDIEISRRSGAIAEWRATDRSRDCVTWVSLWPQGADTTRAQVLSEFEAAGFQPGNDPLE